MKALSLAPSNTGGEKAEARTVNSRLDAVLSAAAARIRFSGFYDLWTSIYQYAVSSFMLR